MKFNKIRLVGATNVDFPIVGADPSGPYVLKSADGLGPPEVDVRIAKTVQEGGVRRGRRPQNRLPVLLVGLQPEWDIGQTASDLRTELYGLLTPKYGQPVVLQLMQDNTVVAQVSGDISKFEIAVFSKDPQVQVTLETTSPYFLAPQQVPQNPARSIVAGKTAIDVENDGDAPAGFWMGVTFQTAPVGPVVLSDDSPTGERMTIGGAWASGDTLVINTIPGQRGVWKIKSGQTAAVSVLNDLTGDSPWIQLHGKDNRLLLSSTAFNWYQNGFSHTPAYWGV